MSHSEVALMNGVVKRLSVLALLGACAAASAQQSDGIVLEADSVSLQGTGSVYRGLTLTDGTVTIDAAEGTTTSDSDDVGLWTLQGLVVAIDTTMLTATTGTLRFTDGRFMEIELLGDPVMLEGSVGDESRPVRLTAGRIAYDAARRLLTVSEKAVFVSDGLEVRNCSWTYNLSDKAVQAVAETASKCVATVAVNRAGAE